MDWYRYSSIRIPFLTTIIRLLFQGKVTWDRRKVFSSKTQELPLSLSENLFFILGFIRSGTTFWSNTLDALLTDWSVVHEPFISDYLAYLNFHGKSKKARLDYIKSYKKADLVSRLANLELTGYGEANPYLRLYGQELKEVFPQAKICYLVRDPRAVVRSVMSREIMGAKDPVKSLYSPPSNINTEQWDAWSRFEKVCYLWGNDNKRLHQQVEQYFKLEDLTQNFEVFQQFLSFLIGGANRVDYHVWEERVSRPMNKTPDYTIDHWKNWSSEQKAIFEKHCLDTMQKHNYDLVWR
jgi:hypothetical protein